MINICAICCHKYFGRCYLNHKTHTQTHFLTLYLCLLLQKSLIGILFRHRRLKSEISFVFLLLCVCVLLQVSFFSLLWVVEHMSYRLISEYTRTERSYEIMERWFFIANFLVWFNLHRHSINIYQWGVIILIAAISYTLSRSPARLLAVCVLFPLSLSLFGKYEIWLICVTSIG